MSENRDNMIDPAAEIRNAIDRLAAELRLTRIAIEEMVARDACECSPGYTWVRREMN